MLFLYYLNEIKYRIFYCCLSYIFNFFISFFYVKELLFISVKPLLDINNIHEFSYFIFTNMVDVLMVYIKIILVVSFIFTIPVFLIQFWFFLVNGLYRYEKNFLFFILFLSFFLFFCIIVLLYAYLIPFIWLFFLNFELTSINSLFGMYYEARITDYIDFMLYIYILFCCFIQLPIVMILCIYYGLLKIEFFINYRKYFIIGTFIVGGLFSPPDILSQIFISMFVLVIFEVIIIFVLLINNYIKKMINKC